MNEFLIFYAPFLIVFIGIIFLFYWSAYMDKDETKHNPSKTKQ